MKRLFKPFVMVLALALLFEEWLWDSLKAQVHRLSRLPAVKRLETLLGRLPPWASLLVMALPGLLLLPFKLAGLWALSNGHPILGMGIFVLAKLAGTALAAYLFDLVRDNARKMAWFERIYTFVMAVIARAKLWLVAQPAYLNAKSLALRWKTAARAWMSAAKGRGTWGRRVAAAKAAWRNKA